MVVSRNLCKRDLLSIGRSYEWVTASGKSGLGRYLIEKVSPSDDKTLTHDASQPFEDSGAFSFAELKLTEAEIAKYAREHAGLVVCGEQINHYPARRVRA